MTKYIRREKENVNYRREKQMVVKRKKSWLGDKIRKKTEKMKKKRRKKSLGNRND